MQIRDILRQKGREVVTVDVDLEVIEAAERMIDKKIGALLVEDKGTLAGIVTERDIVTLVADASCNVKGMHIREIMVRREKLIVAELDDREDYVMAVMIQKGIRHMPILEGNEVVGIVSIRDVIKAHLQNLKDQMTFLTDIV